MYIRRVINLPAYQLKGECVMADTRSGLETKMEGVAVGLSQMVMTEVLTKAVAKVSLDGAYKTFVNELGKELDAAGVKDPSNSIDPTSYLHAGLSGSSVWGVLSGHKFNGSELIALFEKQSEQRLLALGVDNLHLKGALEHLNGILGFIERVMNEQFKRNVVSPHYHFVLLSLRASLQLLFDEVANKKNSLNSERTVQLMTLSSNIASKFDAFANATGNDAGTALGRKEVSRCLNEDMGQFLQSLTRYKSQKPLEDSIAQVGNGAYQASVSIAQLLLSLVVVDDAVVGKTEDADVISSRLTEINGIIAAGRGVFRDIEGSLHESKHKSEGLNREEHEMFSRLFAPRMKTLLADEKAYRSSLDSMKLADAIREKQKQHESGYKAYQEAKATWEREGNTSTAGKKALKVMSLSGKKADFDQYEACSSQLLLLANEHTYLKGANKKHLVFLVFWFDMLKKMGTSKSKEIPADLERFKKEYESCTGDFKVLNATLNKEKAHVVTTQNEAKFLHGLMICMTQLYQLQAFTAALTNFMQVVGQLGMYKAYDLHVLLTTLIEKAQDTIKSQLGEISDMTPANAQNATWISRANKILKQVAEQGKSTIAEMTQMKGLFADLQKKEKIDERFNQVRNSLLNAAEGLGLSVSLEPANVEKLTLTLKEMNTEFFVVKADAATQKRLEEKQNKYEASLQVVGAEIAEGVKQAHLMQNELKGLQTQVTHLKEDVQKAQTAQEGCDQAVKDYLDNFKTKSNELLKNAENQVKEAEQLHDSAQAIIAPQQQPGEQKGERVGEQKQEAPGALLKQATELQQGLKMQLELLKQLTTDAMSFQEKYNKASNITKVALEQIKQNAELMDGRIENLRKLLDSLQKMIDALQAHIDVLQQENKGLKQEIADLKAGKAAVGVVVDVEPALEESKTVAIPAGVAPKQKPAKNPNKIHAKVMGQMVLQSMEISFDKDKDRFKRNYIQCLEDLLPTMREEEKISFANYLAKDTTKHELKRETGFLRKGIFTPNYSNQTRSMAIIQGLIMKSVSEEKRGELLYAQNPENYKRHENIYREKGGVVPTKGNHSTPVVKN